MRDRLFDGHAHSQFSWDARRGAMLGSCERARELQLGGIAFTEHLDFGQWVVPAGSSIDPDWSQYLDGRTLRFPPLDIERYLSAIAKCRRVHPELTIVCGVEVSDPHHHQSDVAAVLARGCFDRVISSVHAVPIDGELYELASLFGSHAPADVMRAYLGEVVRMIEAGGVDVLGHIDYAARYWPAAARPLDSADFETEYRGALAALAARDGTLEINTRIPLDPQISRWWCDEGGEAVTFGADSHAPDEVGTRLKHVAELAIQLGFRRSDELTEPWRR